MKARLILLAGFALPAMARATTYHVPADYPTIQDALNQCSIGDTVLVAPGTYDDYILVDGVTGAVAYPPDGVVLTSEGGADVTVIDLSGAPGGGAVGVFCRGHASGITEFSGFKFLLHRPACNGILVDGCAHVEIRDCIFEVDSPVVPDTSTYRRGIRNTLSDVRVSGCTFYRCMAGGSAGINSNSGPLVVESCAFIECQNQAISAQGGLGSGPQSLDVENCLFQGDVSDGGGAAVSAADLPDGVTIDGCTLESLTTSGVGSIAIGGQLEATVSNCVFSDIEMPTGNGACISVSRSTCEIVGNTMTYVHQVYGTGAAVNTLYATPTFERNIVAHTSGTTALAFESGNSVTAGCNVFWDNADGIGYTPRPTDRIADPLFCNEDTRDLTLQPASPCLPENSLGCGLIGALGEGCGSISVKPQSWGRTKSAYRSGEE